jgi:Mg-chelatase subunit ChlD
MSSFWDKFKAELITDELPDNIETVYIDEPQKKTSAKWWEFCGYNRRGNEGRAEKRRNERNANALFGYTPLSKLKEQTLDYSYIVNTAGVFGSANGVKVVNSTDNYASHSDTDENTVNVNPMLFLTCTKAQALAIMLHDIGLKAHTLPSYSAGEELKTYALDAINGMRIDTLMAQKYAGAEDLRQTLKEYAKALAMGIDKDAINYRYYSEKTNPKMFEFLRVLMLRHYGEIVKNADTKTIEAVVSAIPYVRQFCETADKDKAIELFEPIWQIIKNFAPEVDNPQENKAMADMRCRNESEVSQGYQKRLEGRETLNSDMPKQWHRGDIDALNDSVRHITAELIRQLAKIKKEDSAVRYEMNQKRGRITSSHIYRAGLNDTRVFERRLPSVDRVQQSAVSLLVDRSGSMRGGDRSIHAMRATLALANACSALDIPYEVITFNASARKDKRFTTYATRAKLEDVLRSIRTAGGGTRIREAISDSDIGNVPKRQKLCIIITDGEAEQAPQLKSALDNQRNTRAMLIQINGGYSSTVSSIQQLNDDKLRAYSIDTLDELADVVGGALLELVIGKR